MRAWQRHAFRQDRPVGHRPFPRPGEPVKVAGRADFVAYKFAVTEDSLKLHRGGVLALLRHERRVGIAKMREKAGWSTALKLRRIEVERDLWLPGCLVFVLIAEAYRI